VTEYVMRTRNPVDPRKLARAAQIGLIFAQGQWRFCGVPCCSTNASSVLWPCKALRKAHLTPTPRDDAGGASELSSPWKMPALSGRAAKSRHLTLLNNISRNVITTLNPDEMLPKLPRKSNKAWTTPTLASAARLFEQGIVIQAEAASAGSFGAPPGFDGNGRTRGAHRADGRVTYQVPEKTEECRCWKVHSPPSRSRSVYADQLHGVLYVETDQNADFPQEEVLFLGTLADLISGALHNAYASKRRRTSHH